MPSADSGDANSWKKECTALLNDMMKQQDTVPFRAPVPYEEYGLFDYPTIVKHPMDLGTVQSKLSDDKYSSPKEFQADVNLVWDNCMLYNQEGSEYYKLALRLKKKFKDKFAKLRNPHKAKPPKDDEKAKFSQNIFSLESDQLGHVVRILDDKCDRCIDKTDPEEIEIDVDKIDAMTFRALETYIKQCKEENDQKRKLQKKNLAPAHHDRSDPSSEQPAKKVKT